MHAIPGHNADSHAIKLYFSWNCCMYSNTVWYTTHELSTLHAFQKDWTTNSLRRENPSSDQRGQRAKYWVEIWLNLPYFYTSLECCIWNLAKGLAQLHVCPLANFPLCHHRKSPTSLSIGAVLDRSHTIRCWLPSMTYSAALIEQIVQMHHRNHRLLLADAPQPMSEAHNYSNTTEKKRKTRNENGIRVKIKLYMWWTLWFKLSFKKSISCMRKFRWSNVMQIKSGRTHTGKIYSIKKIAF